MSSMTQHVGARPRAQRPAHRGGRDPRADRSHRRRRSSAPSICCTTAAAASSSPAWASRASSAARSPPRSRAPARRRGSCTRPRPSTATSARIREDDVVLALSHSGETEELVRLLESIRRIGARLIAITGDPASTLGAGGRRHARLQRRRGSVPDEPRADRQHHRGARAGRCAGDDAARAQGLQRRAVRVAPPGRQARPAAAARRERRCTPATRPRSCGRRRRCRT